MDAKYFRKLIDFAGTQSAGRFGFLLSVVLSNVVVWYTWLFVSIWTRTVVDIPEGVYITYGIANGVAFMGKGVQSFAERSSAGSSSSSSTTRTESKTE
jgi:hypothetical protein